MHLTETQIALFLEKKLSPGETRETKTHIAECSSCAQMLADVYRLSGSLKSLPVPDIDKEKLHKAEGLVQNSTSSIKKSSVPKFAFAGFAVIIIGAIIISLLNSEQQPSRFRSNSNAEISIGLQPADESILTSSGLNFKWKSIPRSIAYRFLLYKETGIMIGNFLVRDTLFVLPGSVILQSNTKYLWRIEIIFPDETRQRSGLFVFTYTSSE